MLFLNFNTPSFKIVAPRGLTLPLNLESSIVTLASLLVRRHTAPPPECATLSVKVQLSIILSTPTPTRLTAPPISAVLSTKVESTILAEATSPKTTIAPP